MKILDRYVLFSFIKNYLISLMVLLGLYIVLDMVFNFDELTEFQQASVVATVSEVSATGKQLRATLSMPRADAMPHGAEFRLTDAAGKNTGTLTVESTDSTHVSGPVALPSISPTATTTQAAPELRVGQFGTAPAPATSTLSVISSIGNYYFHQSFLFFVQLSGVIPVVAAAFTLIRMSRFNELTAILAAGVPLLRVAMPIVYCGVVINFILLPLNQEVIIPSMIPELTLKHDELQQNTLKTFPIHAMQDDNHSLLNAGRFTPAVDRKPAHIDVLDVIERDENRNVIAHMAADSADYDPDTGSWNLINGTRVTGLGIGDNHTSQAPIATWKTSISPEEIALYRTSDFVELLATDKINQLLERGESYGRANLLRVKHFRWSQLLINIVLLLLAIPCVLTREPGTLKTDVMKCSILTGACMATIFLSRQIAGNPPSGSSLAPQWPLIMAWVPIFLFLPLAIFLLDQKHTKKT